MYGTVVQSASKIESLRTVLQYLCTVLYLVQFKEAFYYDFFASHLHTALDFYL